MEDRAVSDALRASYAGELARDLIDHQLRTAISAQQDKLLYLHMQGDEAFSRGLRELFLTVNLMDVPRFLSEAALRDRIANPISTPDPHAHGHEVAGRGGWSAIQAAIVTQLDTLMLASATQLLGGETSEHPLLGAEGAHPFASDYRWFPLSLHDAEGNTCEACAAWGRKLGYTMGEGKYHFFSVSFALPGRETTEDGLFAAIIPAMALRDQVLKPAIESWKRASSSATDGTIAAQLGDSERAEHYLLRIVDQEGDTVFPLEDAAATTDMAALLILPVFGEASPWKLELRAKGDTQLAQLESEHRRWTIYFLSVVALLSVGAFLLSREFLHQVEHARLRSHLLSNISHELKTPLSLIRLYADTLESGRVREDSERVRFLAIISREGKRLTHLIDNLLDVQRIEEGRKNYSYAQVKPDRVVRTTYEAYRFQLSELGFDLRLDVDENLPLLMLDEEAMAQALINLLDNASKYSDTIKEIRVHCWRRDGEVLIRVTDRGIGIPAREHDRIFQSFYRVEKGLIHDVKGSGLGLAVVRHVARAHGGSVEVESTVGKGSSFTIHLPVDFDPSLA